VADGAAVVSAVAALVGAGAAAYDIWVRREDKRRAEERQRDERERVQASRVFAWARGLDVNRSAYLIHVENRSDAPVWELLAVVEPQHPGQCVSEGSRVLGLLPPGKSAELPASVRGNWPDDPAGATVELVFTDAEGRTWRRQGSALERGELVASEGGRVARWQAWSSPATVAGGATLRAISQAARARGIGRRAV